MINPTPHLQQQNLLFDADDTLWENNIYFERAIASFISYLDHRIHTDEEVREHLNQCERITIAEHGYGLSSFRRSLIDCYEQLTDTTITPEKHERIVAFTEAIASEQIELLPGVTTTLAELSLRHRCLLVTKGSYEEQVAKLDRSGLREYFTAVEVLAEKEEFAYRNLIAHHGCDAHNTWMIGNSPRSDINPALAAGLHAVFLPHDSTWVMEHEVVIDPPVNQTLLKLSTFSELTQHF